MRRSKIWLGPATLLLALAAVSGAPERARACTCTPSPIARSSPESGATGVALNQAVLVSGNFVADSLTLEEPDGKAVAADVTHGPTPSCPGVTAELIPRAPLRANTKYRVRVRPVGSSSDGADRFDFTTGAELLSDPALAAPRGVASMLSSVPSDGFSCGDGTFYVCLGLEDDDGMEVIARRGSEITMRWIGSESNGAFKLDSAPDCMEVRRRSATGKRSAPLSICGAALRPRPFRDGDRDQTGLIRREGGVIGAASDAASEPTDAGAPPDATTMRAAQWTDEEIPPSAADSCSALPTAHGSGLVPLALMTLLLAARVRRSR